MSQSNERKQVYVVLGMSRSGTSAIARSLQVLNIALGDKLIAADERNPKGFYEDADVLYKINRGLSRALDRRWLSLDSSESKSILADTIVQPFKQLALNTVNNRLRDNANWGFKDPRTDSLLPFWRDVFAAAGVEDHYVIAMRHPLSAAYSNQKFIGIDLETGLLLWIKHLMAVVDGTIGKNRVLISYENLMQSPRQQVQRLHQQLHILQPLSKSGLASYADGFLDRGLNHHQYPDEESANHPSMRVVPLCLRMYRLLMRVANDEMTLDCDEFLMQWQEIKAAHRELVPAYTYIEALIEKNKELQREIRSMRKAISWKITFPLRQVERVLRIRRRVNKEKNRLWETK